MANLNSVLNEQIRRLARREIRSQTKTVKKLTAQYRRAIAALKREVASLHRSVGFLEGQEKRRVARGPAGHAPAPAANGTGGGSSGGAADGLRFRVDGLKSHRAKL